MRELLMAFIRMRSPSKAPPVFRFDGSTEIMAMVLSVSIKKRRTNSSTKDDFPAPPVPVMPNTGIFLVPISFFNSLSRLSASAGTFSAKVIAAAIAGMYFV